MPRLAIPLAMGLLIAAPALAGQCEDDVAKIDKALAAQEVSPEQLSQLEDMRSQAVQLCGAGNEAEGLDVTAEAKALLNIE
jgi:hypothetical protein